MVLAHSVCVLVVLTSNRLDGVSGGKSNVFVVQKSAGSKKIGVSGAIPVSTTLPSAISSAFEKVLALLILIVMQYICEYYNIAHWLCKQ